MDSDDDFLYDATDSGNESPDDEEDDSDDQVNWLVDGLPETMKHKNPMYLDKSPDQTIGVKDRGTELRT